MNALEICGNCGHPSKQHVDYGTDAMGGDIMEDECMVESCHCTNLWLEYEYEQVSLV